MRISSATSASVDESLFDSINERPGQTIRIRVQPTILRQREGDARASYQSWKDLHWLIEITSLQEAQAFRQALTAFFQQLPAAIAPELTASSN